jgi:HSP20 family protein
MKREGLPLRAFFRKVLSEIPLPYGVDSSKIEANHRDGVLTVTLPKSEQAKPKHIDVKVG